jgi:coniferyl-aldehyde dehydrogenase
MTLPNTDPAALPAILHTLRTAWQANRPSLEQRRSDLQRLRAALKPRLPQMAEAIAADFGHRATYESLIADGMTVLNEIDHLLGQLRGWMRPRRVSVGWRFWPARAQTRPVPLGWSG